MFNKCNTIANNIANGIPHRINDVPIQTHIFIAIFFIHLIFFPQSNKKEANENNPFASLILAGDYCPISTVASVVTNDHPTFMPACPSPQPMMPYSMGHVTHPAGCGEDQTISLDCII
jgi:hypothetical protein